MGRVHPALYRLTASLPDPGSASAVTFGLREVGTTGTQFTINGRRTFLRGTLECAIFPKTGHPPTDVASWERIIRIAKAHGLNHIRFHSWCPPKAAFEAADRLGFYYYVEAGVVVEPVHAGSASGFPWTTGSAARRIASSAAYGNHPSFVLMSAGQRTRPGATASSWPAG